MQETQVQSLTREDPTCLGATKAVCYSCWTRALEPENHNYWGQVCSYWSPCSLEPVLGNKRSPHTMMREGPAFAPTREKPMQQQRPSTAKNEWINFFLIKRFALGQPEGWAWEGGAREVQDGGDTWLIHVDIWQKPSQYCNYPPIKINKLKKNKNSNNKKE